MDHHQQQDGHHHHHHHHHHPGFQSKIPRFTTDPTTTTTTTTSHLPLLRRIFPNRIKKSASSCTDTRTNYDCDNRFTTTDASASVAVAAAAAADYNVWCDQEDVVKPSVETILKRDELSLSHLPSAISDMDDDNASLDSLGILTPNQMKDFLEDEEAESSNVIEVIDINGQKIECRLHYEDMQWSSPYLNLSNEMNRSSDRTVVDHDVTLTAYEDDATPTGREDEDRSLEDVRNAVQKLLNNRDANEYREVDYSADTDICLNSRHIIELLQKADLPPPPPSSKFDKPLSSVAPLSESGYHADNESDIQSEGSSTSPAHEQLPVEGIALRESATDSGFYSETRNSGIVGSESDFDDVPRARNVQIIDGKLYCPNIVPTRTETRPVESIPETSAAAAADRMEVEIRMSDDRTDVVMDAEVPMPETDTKDDTQSLKSSHEKRDARVEKSRQAKVISRPIKKPNVVVSKLKQMLENNKTADHNVDEQKQVKRPTAPKKSRWDSITAKIAESMADEKKKPKQRIVKSKIDNKGPMSPTTNKNKNKSFTNKNSSTNKMVATLNRENLSGRTQNNRKNIFPTRPNAQRSNYSDAALKNNSSAANIRNKVTRTGKSDKYSDSTRSPTSVKSAGSSQESIKSDLNNKDFKDGTNNLSLKTKRDSEGVDVVFDQPDLIATAEYEVKLNELKFEKEKLRVDKEDLEREVERLGSLHEEERLRFGIHFDEMKQQINNIHIHYGEEAQKYSEKVNRLYKELEAAVSQSDYVTRDGEQRIILLESRITSLKEDRNAEIKDLKEKYEQRLEDMKREQEMQISKMKNSHKLMQEIESLKSVLELKTEEIHRLRKENMNMMKDLEELPNTQTKLEKLTAKVEDLQEVVTIKSDMERSLTIEHESLRHTVETENKVNKRLSMEIEELQWKLKQSSDSETCSLSPVRSRTYFSKPRSPSVSLYETPSPTSPIKRSFTVSICQVSPSKHTQTDTFLFDSPKFRIKNENASSPDASSRASSSGKRLITESMIRSEPIENFSTTAHDRRQNLLDNSERSVFDDEETAVMSTPASSIKDGNYADLGNINLRLDEIDSNGGCPRPRKDEFDSSDENLNLGDRSLDVENNERSERMVSCDRTFDGANTSTMAYDERTPNIVMMDSIAADSTYDYDDVRTDSNLECMTETTSVSDSCSESNCYCSVVMQSTQTTNME